MTDLVYFPPILGLGGHGGAANPRIPQLTHQQRRLGLNEYIVFVSMDMTPWVARICMSFLRVWKNECYSQVPLDQRQFRQFPHFLP